MVKDLLLQTLKLLSQRIAKLEPFLNETACLNPQEREIIGYCKAYISIYGEEDPLSVAFKERFIPALRYIGFAKWRRTELTDLGFKIAYKDTEEIDLSAITENIQ